MNHNDGNICTGLTCNNPEHGWPELLADYEAHATIMALREALIEVHPDSWVLDQTAQAAAEAKAKIEKQTITTYLNSPEAERALTEALHEATDRLAYERERHDRTTCGHNTEARAVLATWTHNDRKDIP